mmetsp:Transcript_37935/g.42337  ORF Transcript_37935/g.42337 Transcript_37935/m.42337 type:complete len:109 (-) Transcript_37935:92-418(-)
MLFDTQRHCSHTQARLSSCEQNIRYSTTASSSCEQYICYSTTKLLKHAYLSPSTHHDDITFITVCDYDLNSNFSIFLKNTSQSTQQASLTMTIGLLSTLSLPLLLFLK